MRIAELGLEAGEDAERGGDEGKRPGSQPGTRVEAFGHGRRYPAGVFAESEPLPSRAPAGRRPVPVVV